jgi:predicted aspartyl protease
LGRYDIELCHINLQKLLGRENETFTLNTKIVQNGYSLAVEALVDTGANGFAFVDTNLAILIGKFFDLRTVPLEAECAVRGYDGKTETPITHAILLNLVVDGRRQLDLSQHEVPVLCT